MNDSYETAGGIDFNNQWSYPIQWIEESRFARERYQRDLFRVSLAMQGKPWRNLYQEELDSNIKNISDPTQREEFKKACLCVPEGESFELARAVNKRANQVASGVDYYEYQIDDPFMTIDNNASDKMAALCEQEYAQSNLGMKSAMFSRDLDRAGMCAVLVKYCKETDTNKYLRINPKNVWVDTMYSATGEERFRGYSTMISFAKLLKMIEDGKDEVNPDIVAPSQSLFDAKGEFKKNAKIGKKKIKTLNDLTIYVQDMNKLACSTQLQGHVFDYGEYDHDLRTCYNLNWYRTFATDAEARTKTGYNGDDVELTVMYDLERKIMFKIINRRFVISANSTCFRRNIRFDMTNPITREVVSKSKEYAIDCPLVFQFEEDETRDIMPYPVSPIFKLLDTHDKLCAWIARREHVAKILAVLRVETNAADAKSLRGLLNIMGIVLDDIQGDIGSIQYNYDWTAIDTEIARLQKEIISTTSAYDDFDAMQMMGDRASASESGLASGAVAQGLATHQNAIMALYAELARVSNGNRVLYSDKKEFGVVNRGNYDTVTLQDMACSAIINVKSKLAKKVEQRALSSNAITLLGTLRDGITPEATGYFIQQAMFGNVPRAVAERFVKPMQVPAEVVQTNALQAQNMAKMLQQNQQMYEANPMSYEAVDASQNLSPEEMDQVIAGIESGEDTVAQQPGQPEMPEEESEEEVEMTEGQEVTPKELDMEQQEGSIQAQGLQGQTTDMGSMLANASGMVM